MYPHYTVDIHPEKDEPYCTQITCRCDVLDYFGDVMTHTTSMETIKIHWNCVNGKILHWWYIKYISDVSPPQSWVCTILLWLDPTTYHWVLKSWWARCGWIRLCTHQLGIVWIKKGRKDFPKWSHWTSLCPQLCVYWLYQWTVQVWNMWH